MKLTSIANYYYSWGVRVPADYVVSVFTKPLAEGIQNQKASRLVNAITKGESSDGIKYQEAIKEIILKKYPVYKKYVSQIDKVKKNGMESLRKVRGNLDKGSEAIMAKTSRKITNILNSAKKIVHKDVGKLGSSTNIDIPYCSTKQLDELLKK